MYHEKVKTSRVFIRDCSTASVYALVLFGGGQVNVELHKGEFVVSLDDGWIRFAASSHQVRAWEPASPGQRVGRFTDISSLCASSRWPSWSESCVGSWTSFWRTKSRSRARTCAAAPAAPASSA